MIKDKKIVIEEKCDFPSAIAPYSEKKKESFGLGVAKAIESYWFYRQGGSCRFYTSQTEKLLRRAYAKGIQSMDMYYDKLGAKVKGDKSYLNLPKKPITITPKLIEMVCNGLAERDWRIKALAIDTESQKRRESFRRDVEDNYLAKDIIGKAQESFGANVATMPMESIPESPEEVDFHVEMNFKDAVEIAEEAAIDVVFMENKYQQTTERMIRKDMAILGEAAAKHRFVPSKGLVIDYVDPVNMVHSYTEDPWRRDVYYVGEFKQVMIADVLVEFPWINDNEEIKEQLVSSGTYWNNYHFIGENERLRGTAYLLYFTYTTTRERPKKIKTKGTGEKVVSQAAEVIDENAFEQKDFERLTALEKVEFEGVMVLGTDIMLKWELSENMIRPKSNKRDVIPQYRLAAPNCQGGYIDSLVARMMPIEDELQVVRLKNCQMIQRMVPDGFFFDIDGFLDIDMGEGTVKSQELFDMLFQTGSTMGRSYGSDGNYNAAKIPVSVLNMPGNTEKINTLRVERDFNLNMLREVIGLNNASDASSPDKDSLVGIQKLAAANSNVATRYVLQGVNWITMGLAEASTYRIADILQYSELKNDLIEKIGANAVVDLESVKNMHLSDFAIFLEMALDDEERAKLEADLSAEIAKGFISTSDKYKILAVRNFKRAIQYLDILKKQNAKRVEAEKLRAIEAQTQGNIQSAQAAEQAKQQTIQIEGQVKAQIQELINQGLIQKEQVAGEQMRMVEELKAKYKLEWQSLVNSGQAEKINTLETEKNKRSLQEGTMQGEIAYNKEHGKQPTDFVAKNANMGQFELDPIE